MSTNDKHIYSADALLWWKRGYQDARARAPYRQAPQSEDRERDISPEALAYWDGWQGGINDSASALVNLIETEG